MASIDDIFGKEMMQKINEEQKKSDDTKLSDGSPLPFDKIVDKYIPPNRRPWHADDTLDLVNNKSMKNLEQIDEHKKDQNSSLISKSIIDNNLENSSDKHQKETGNKVATKWQQSGNKVATNRQQSGNKNDSEKINWQQSGNTTDNTIGNKVATKWQQSGNNSFKKESFSKLVGLQREIIIFICGECKNSRSKVTESLSLEYISKSLKRSNGAVKTTLQRLEIKKCIKRVDFKNGRGGWSKYEVPDDVYHDVLRNETDNKVATKWQQTGNKVATQPTTEPTTNPSSSSSINNKKTTTTRDDDIVPNFDISEYKQSVGFFESHYKQICDMYDDEQIVDALENLKFDVENNKKFNKSPMNLFMHAMKVVKAPYVSIEYQDHMRAQANILKQKLADGRRAKQELELFTWYESLSTAAKAEIMNKAPAHILVDLRVDNITQPNVFEYLWTTFSSAK